MSDKELLQQIFNREIANILGSFGGSFRLIAPTVSNYLFSLAEPYIDAFMDNDSGKINSKVAGAFVKEEISSKVDDFIKRFESQQKENKE